MSCCGYYLPVKKKESKPVYISIGCNLPAVPHSSFSCEPVPFALSPRLTNQQCLEAAVEATVEFLNKAVKPVLVDGPKIRMAKAGKAIVEPTDASGYPVAVMSSAKGLVPEHHDHFIGTYWGAVSIAFSSEIVRRWLPLRWPHLQRLQLRRVLTPAQEGQGHCR